MPRPPRMQSPPVDRSNVEYQLVTLVNDFQSSWQDFFCEEELHAHFYHQCREAFPRYKTNDGIQTPSFHHRYPTFWRYLEGDRFAERQLVNGNYKEFDFVVLKDTFLERGHYQNVTNRHELSKKIVRNYPGTNLQSRSSAIQFAIEIKLSTQSPNGAVDIAEINRLEGRLLDATRKLAAEQIPNAYVVGVSQGPQPDLSRAQAMVSMCLQLHQARYPAGQLSVLIATPHQTVLGGDWSEQVEFPNVTMQDGWPVSRVT